jgi:hypothetical protein
MRAAALALLVSLGSPAAHAQLPDAVNARVIARPARPDVARAIAAIAHAQIEPAWIGYAVPAVHHDSSGRDDGWSERCRLEQLRVEVATHTLAAGPIRLEPSPSVMVLVRVQGGEIRRLRPLSGDCQVDAGGLPLYWLADAPGAESVDFLKALVAAGTRPRDPSDGALTALALHRDAAAGAAIVDLARNGAPQVRQRALLWMARRAEAHASGVITRAIDEDANVDVKKQAVFALSQLPGDKGIPLLIGLARGHSHPVVRRQAMHWLGQSKDPRVLSFFEELLR